MTEIPLGGNIYPQLTVGLVKFVDLFESDVKYGAVHSLLIFGVIGLQIWLLLWPFYLTMLVVAPRTHYVGRLIFIAGGYLLLAGG